MVPDRRTLLAAALAVIGILCFALVAPKATAQSTTHDYVGAESCRGCHAGAYKTWANGPHARAFSRLSEADKKDRRCLECHTMVPGEGDPMLAGIQCESCHGPGRFYAKKYVMQDHELRESLFFQKVTEETCKRCHTDKSPSIRGFDLKLKLERIRHWEADPDEATK
jgi:hypothetical protein